MNFNKFAAESALNKIYKEVPSREIDSKSGVDLIAEPWAIDMYDLGEFPEKWAEWNGKFRDTMRKKLNQLGYETVTPDELVRNIGGSSHIFQPSYRGPYHSINFMVAHDGFTLRDLFSFNSKQNTALRWPMGPSGGGEDTNHSWDQGGQIEDQVKAVKNALSLLLLSAGTPMITAGDENFRTQFGNNNSYNLDTSANWLNWAEFNHSAEAKSVFSYAQEIIALRNKVGALRRNDFFKGQDFNGNGIKDIVWLTDQGEMTGDQYGDANRHVIGYRLDLTEENNPDWKALVVYFNFDSADKQIHLPFWIGASGSPSSFDPTKWTQFASSAKNSNTPVDTNGNFLMESRSTIVFVEK